MVDFETPRCFATQPARSSSFEIFFPPTDTLGRVPLVLSLKSSSGAIASRRFSASLRRRWQRPQAVLPRLLAVPPAGFDEAPLPFFLVSAAPRMRNAASEECSDFLDQEQRLSHGSAPVAPGQGPRHPVLRGCLSQQSRSTIPPSCVHRLSPCPNTWSRWRRSSSRVAPSPGNR